MSAYPRALCAILLVAGAGCLRGGGDGGWDAGADAAVRGEVQIGIPDDRLAFLPLARGGEIPLETFGQGGTHATLAVRCIGFGNQAFVDVSLENLDTGQTVATVPATRPPLLICRADGPCDLAPIHVMTGGLAGPDQKDGLRVRVTAEVRNLDGVHGSASVEGVLRQM